MIPKPPKCSWYKKVTSISLLQPTLRCSSVLPWPLKLCMINALSHLSDPHYLVPFFTLFIILQQCCSPPALNICSHLRISRNSSGISSSWLSSFCSNLTFSMKCSLNTLLKESLPCALQIEPRTLLTFFFNDCFIV